MITIFYIRTNVFYCPLNSTVNYIFLVSVKWDSKFMLLQNLHFVHLCKCETPVNTGCFNVLTCCRNMKTHPIYHTHTSHIFPFEILTHKKHHKKYSIKISTKLPSNHSYSTSKILHSTTKKI